MQSSERQILEALAAGAELVPMGKRRANKQSKWALSWPGQGMIPLEPGSPVGMLRQRGYLIRSRDGKRLKLSRYGEHALDECRDR